MNTNSGYIWPAQVLLESTEFPLPSYWYNLADAIESVEILPDEVRGCKGLMEYIDVLMWLQRNNCKLYVAHHLAKCVFCV